MDHDAALAALERWAVSDPNVRALVLTGSGAAREVHALSDRDVEVYARDVAPLLADEGWWRGLGEVLVVERTENDLGRPTRLIYYAGGKLDFTLVPANELRDAGYERPFEVLLDKDGLASTARRVEPRRGLPDEAEFDRCVNEGYAAALMCAKAVVRDELWPAKVRDEDLKWQLLRLIEWDHRARYGTGYDTWHLGRRMNAWLDADIRAELAACWGRFDAADTVAALRRTVALFTRLATRTAERLGFPAFDHDRVRAELDAILDVAAPSARPIPSADQSEFD